MKKTFSKTVSLIVCGAILLLCFAGCTEAPQKREAFRVTAYVRGEFIQSDETLHPEDFDIITDVILFECASFDNKGEIIYDKDKLETALKNLRTAIGERDVNITLNLLGPGPTTDSTVWEQQMESQSDEHNKAFESGVLEKNIVKILDKYSFDGVHFDYEYPLSNKAWKVYNRFLVSLDEQLGEYTLGVTFVDWNMNYTGKAAKAVDSFELMTYDYVDSNGKHATYDDTVAIIEGMKLKAISPYKVNIGLPFYSRPTDMSAYWYGYSECYEKINADGWYHCDEINKDFWFNTPSVIEKKTDYAINNGYGGVMLWHYTCDLPSSQEGSLLRAIADAVEKADI